MKKIPKYFKLNLVLMIGIIIVFYFLFKCRHFDSIWLILNQNLVSTLLGTFLGAGVAFYIKSKDERRLKEYSFGVLADQIAFEWIANSQFAKEILNTLESGYATVRRFNLGMVELSLGGYQLYEFSTKEFISKLRIYRENILIVNKLMDYFFEKSSNTQEDVDRLKKQINNVIQLIDEIGKIPIR